jgi:nitroimidazol reductase NimA-like FMN-containing flavoprotein (pyridoxamine 5'-phosphate oxidase superfamily)
MSSPQIRRADRAMSDERTLETLAQGYSGRLATVSEDGFPYCIPLLYQDKWGGVFTHRERRRTFARKHREGSTRLL